MTDVKDIFKPKELNKKNSIDLSIESTQSINLSQSNSKELAIKSKQEDLNDHFLHEPFPKNSAENQKSLDAYMKPNKPNRMSQLKRKLTKKQSKSNRNSDDFLTKGRYNKKSLHEKGSLGSNIKLALNYDNGALKLNSSQEDLSYETVEEMLSDTETSSIDFDGRDEVVTEKNYSEQPVSMDRNRLFREQTELLLSLGMVLFFTFFFLTLHNLIFMRKIENSFYETFNIRV